MKTGKRIMSILVALALCVAMLPAAALADDSSYLLAMGDSITSGYGLEDVDTQSYPAILAAALGLEVVNTAEDGMTAEVLCAELQTGTYDETIAGASAITLTIGGDDMLTTVYNTITDAYSAANGTAYTLEEMKELLADLSSNYLMSLSLLSVVTDEEVLTGLLEDITPALETLQADLTELVAYLRTVNPDATIVVATQYNPYQWLGSSYAIVSDVFADGTAAMNAVITAGAANGDYIVADVAAAFAASEEKLVNADMSALSLDFHPNAAGHEVIAATMLAALTGEETAEESTAAEAEAAATPFTDIADSPYAEAIEAVYAAGLMNGVSDTSFDPDGELTRAMVYTIVYRLMGEPAVTGDAVFSDVAAGLWYSDAATWAAGTGLATGYTDGTFQPTTSVTREQLATILYRYAVSLGMDTSAAAGLGDYADAASVHDYAAEAVQWAVACGILTGRAEGTLEPTAAATRAEVAQALYMLIQ